jgi:hypothetical protein
MAGGQALVRGIASCAPSKREGVMLLVSWIELFALITLLILVAKFVYDLLNDKNNKK